MSADRTCRPSERSRAKTARSEMPDIKRTVCGDPCAAGSSGSPDLRGLTCAHESRASWLVYEHLVGRYVSSLLRIVWGEGRCNTAGTGCRGCRRGTHTRPSLKENQLMLRPRGLPFQPPARFEFLQENEQPSWGCANTRAISTVFGVIHTQLARGLPTREGEGSGLSTSVERPVETSGVDNVQNADQLWETCSDLIRAQVSDVVWNTTFRELEAIDLTTD